MNIKTDIICSECDVDLKDKTVMGETGKIKEKTIGDLFAQAIVADQGQGCIVHSGIASTVPSLTSASLHTSVQAVADYCYQSEVIGNEWVIPSKAIEQQILNGNEFNYIHMSISLKIPDCKVLVLCEVRKDHWSDGSYKRSYHPLTYSKLKRMPE